MDVDKLRAELETHLAKNPHEDAPGGFRDRFEAVAEEYAANDGDFPKETLEAQLQRIRDEAEAAWTCETDGGTVAEPAEAAETAVAAEPAAAADPEAATAAEPAPAIEPKPRAAPEPPAPPEPGFVQRYGIALTVAVVALAAGYFYFR